MIKSIQLIAVYDDDMNDVITAIILATPEDLRVYSNMIEEATKGTEINFCGWNSVNCYAPNSINEGGMKFYFIDFENEGTSLKEIVELVKRFL